MLQPAPLKCGPILRCDSLYATLAVVQYACAVQYIIAPSTRQPVNVGLARPNYVMFVCVTRALTEGPDGVQLQLVGYGYFICDTHS